MTREKIISLARECGMSHHTLLIGNEIEAFYHAAQAEVFEATAVACDCMANGWKNNPGNNPMAGYIASSNCATAIREMAKEMR